MLHSINSDSTTATPSRKKIPAHVRIPTAWRRHWVPLIGSSAFSVYCELLSYLGKNDGVFPSHKTISDNTGLSISTVKRALATLKAHGLISWSQRFEETEYGHERQASNVYFLAQNELPPSLKITEAPGPKRATKQEWQKNEVEKEQTAPRASFASSPSESCPVSASPELTQQVEHELEVLAVLNTTTRRAALKAPQKALQRLQSLRERLAKGADIPNRHGWFMQAMKGQNMPIEAPPPPQKDGTRLVSEADLAMERETREEQQGGFQRNEEPVEPLIAKAMAMAARPVWEVAQTEAVTKPKRSIEDVMADAKRDWQKWKNEKMLLSFRERLAPGYTLDEWAQIVAAAAREEGL